MKEPTVRQVDLYKQLLEVAAPHHAYKDQIMAITMYVDTELKTVKTMKKILTDHGTYTLQFTNDKKENFYINEFGDVWVTDSEDKPLYDKLKAKKYYARNKKKSLRQT